ncbi:MAG: NADPH-dependent glutamate synthase [Nanoarchaeota archaeon]
MKDRIKSPEQDPSKRVKNFDEVCLGYDDNMAVEEASRCLQCAKPKCVSGCPVHVDIPNFIKHIKDGKNDMALNTILKTNNLPGVCGRVCPQEKQCENECVLKNAGKAINIGKLERYAADKGKKEVPHIGKKKKKVAIIGSGPAGLTCAADLAVMGYKVIIYEALHDAGGVLTYGIPEFRLPKKIVKEEVESIKQLGVEIKPNYVIGRILTVDELIGKNDAVFIACGAGLPYFLDIPGENLTNVYSANEFLTRINLMKAYKFPDYKTPIKIGKKVVVVGAGNVAIDAARCARRLGSEVTIVYRRSFEEMPARIEEINHAKEEGIKFLMLTNPAKILGEKKVEGMECIQMMLGEADDSGRRRPVPIEDSNFIVECDQAIIAIGQGPNPLLLNQLKVEKSIRGSIIVDENCRTSRPGIFAGGDIASSEATVIKAMGMGKKAAKAIAEYVEEQTKLKEFETT